MTELNSTGRTRSFAQNLRPAMRKPMASVRTTRLPVHGDERGMLTAIEEGSGVHFPIRRVYYIFDTSDDVTRGKHAHKMLRQLLVCVHGQCVVDTELPDGVKETHTLNSASQGLIIEGLVWREMRNFSEGSVLLVLASSAYDELDYIRDYTDFKAAC